MYKTNLILNYHHILVILANFLNFLINFHLQLRVIFLILHFICLIDADLILKLLIIIIKLLYLQVNKLNRFTQLHFFSLQLPNFFT